MRSEGVILLSLSSRQGERGKDLQEDRAGDRDQEEAEVESEPADPQRGHDAPHELMGGSVTV